MCQEEGFKVCLHTRNKQALHEHCLNLKNLEHLSVLWLASLPLQFIFVLIFQEKGKKKEIVSKTCKFYFSNFFNK
jgi:hypothetical protein